MFKKVIKEELRVPASIDSLKDLRDFVSRVGKRHRFHTKVINAFKLAVDEASTNIIRHSYRDRVGDITIRALVRKGSFTISLIDQGRFFDPTTVKDPDLRRYVAIGKRGGLGIFMIRKLVDEITYHHTEEGNELRLTKNKGVERKRRIAFIRLPESLRMKYYTVSAAMVSTAVLIGYVYNFINTDAKILNNTFVRMGSLAGIISQNVGNDLRDEKVLEVSRKADGIVRENSRFVKMAVITDVNNLVSGTSKTNSLVFPLYEPFDAGDTLKTYRRNIQLMAKDLPDFSLKQFFTIQREVFSIIEGKRTLVGYTYLFVPAQPVFREIRQKRLNDLKLAGLLLLLSNLGIGLLIFLIFTPLQKLSNWVRDMGQTDIRDQIDIDTSNEIGKIAQAFGEITDKFRESQKSLADRERIQQEMQLAKEIQHTLLPAEFPEIKGYEIASHYEAAKEVGGDYYDFVEVDRNRTGVVVADVSGKGVPGSLVMTMIRTTLRTEARGVGSAAEVLAKVNDFVIGDIRKGMFVTLFYIILDSRKRRVTFASAGHNPLILYRASTQKTYYLNPKGFPVGISLHESDLFRRSIEDDTIQLTKGDIILLYTDGITEAMNSKRELFGEERLLEVIRQYGHLRAKQFVEKLKEELVAFTEGQIQYDDITFVVIKEKMTPEESELERADAIYYEMLNGMSIREACEKHGMPVSTFSHKYRHKLEEKGAEEFRKEFENTSVEARHLSIEEQTKIYDIIRKHPQWGPKRISESLNTEEYGFTQIPENRVYEELVRKRLNTRALREAYVSRDVNKKRMKPPGTPMLTLDGQVIMDEELGPKLHAPLVKEPAPKRKEKEELKEIKYRREKKSIEEKEEAELILSDIVDLFDKSRKAGKQEEQGKIEEIEGELEPLELDSKSEEESEIATESELEELLGDLISEEPAQKVKSQKEEIEFTDLSASEYSEDLFEDRADGGGGGETPAETAQGDTKQKSLEQMLGDLSVAGEMASEEEAALDDFAVLLSEEKLDSDEGVESRSDEKAVPKQESGEDQENEQQAAQAGRESLPLPGGESRPVAEIFNTLSVEMEDQSDVVVHKSGEEADNIEELFDLISEEEINIQEEFLSPHDKNGALDQKERKDRRRKSAVDSQQKLLIAGGHFYLQKKYEKAVQIFQRLIEKYPNNIEGYYNLGNSFFRLRRFDQAQKAYEKVCELDPTFLDALENLGVIFANKQDYKQAIQIWKKILEYDPKREDIKKNIEKAFKISRRTETSPRAQSK